MDTNLFVQIFQISSFGIVVYCILYYLTVNCSTNRTVYNDSICLTYELMYQIIKNSDQSNQPNQSNQPEQLDSDSVPCECDECNNNKIPSDLGARIKYYEKETYLNYYAVDPYDDYIIRLDGRAFSKLTKCLKTEAGLKGQSYSDEFKNAMRKTAEELLIEFNASVAYTHSDEITLIFPKLITYEQYNKNIAEGKQNPCHPFDGKFLKLISIVSSHASVSFYENMHNELKKSKSVNYDKYFSNLDCQNESVNKFANRFIFDARIIVFPLEKDYEIVNHMIWRSKYDCYRNFVSLLLENNYSHKEVQNIKSSQRVKMLKDKGIDIDETELGMRYGIYIKKANKKTTKMFCLPQIKCNSSYYKFLTDKYFSDSYESVVVV